MQDLTSKSAQGASSAELLELSAWISWLKPGGRCGDGGPTPLLTVSDLSATAHAPAAHLSAWSLRSSRAPLRVAHLSDEAQLKRLWRLALRSAPYYGPSLRWLSTPPLPLTAESLDALLQGVPQGVSDLGAHTAAVGGGGEGGEGRGAHITLSGRSLDLSLCLTMSLWIAELRPQVGFACSAECGDHGELKPVKSLGLKVSALAPCDGISLLIVSSAQRDEAQAALSAAGLSGRVRAVGVETIDEALRVLFQGRALKDPLARTLALLSDQELAERARQLSRLALSSEDAYTHLSHPLTASALEAVWRELNAPHRAGACAALTPLRHLALNEARLSYLRHIGSSEARWGEVTAALLEVIRKVGDQRPSRSGVEALRWSTERLSGGGLSDDIACDQLASRLQSLTDQDLAGAAALDSALAGELHAEVDRQLSGGALSVGAAKLWGARARWRFASGALRGALDDSISALVMWEGLSQRLTGEARAALLNETSRPLCVAYRAVTRLEDREGFEALEGFSCGLEGLKVPMSYFVLVERAGAALRWAPLGEVEGHLVNLLAVASHHLPEPLRAPRLNPTRASEPPSTHISGVAAVRLTERLGDDWRPEGHAGLFARLRALDPRYAPYLTLQESYCAALVNATLDAAIAPAQVVGLQGLAAVQRGLREAPLTWRALSCRYSYL